MGILSINRNLLSKFKPTSLSSSDLCFFRRIFSQAAVPDPGTINPNQAHQAPSILVGDIKPFKPMFLIDHVYRGISKYEQLSAAAAASAEICNPFSGRPGKYRLVGSCKELTVFWREDYDKEPNQIGKDYDGSPFHQYQRRLYLWNPTTNCIKTLPLSTLPRLRPVLRVDIAPHCVALGFDPKSRDYKVLCFLEYDYSDMTDSCGEPHIELYSLKTDSWKKIRPSYYFNSPAIHTSTCFSFHINGVYYWARQDILSFDFSKEKFSRMPLPPHILKMRDNYCLAEFHGLLAIIVPYMVPVEELTEEERKRQMQQPFSIKIWVLSGKKWKLAPRVAVGDFPVGDRIFSLLGLFQNDYLVLQDFNSTEILLFNCKTGKLENLGFQHDQPESCFSRRKLGIFPYDVLSF